MERFRKTIKPISVAKTKKISDKIGPKIESEIVKICSPICPERNNPNSAKLETAKPKKTLGRAKAALRRAKRNPNNIRLAGIKNEKGPKYEVKYKLIVESNSLP